MQKVPGGQGLNCCQPGQLCDHEIFVGPAEIVRCEAAYEEATALAEIRRILQHAVDGLPGPREVGRARTPSPTSCRSLPRPSLATRPGRSSAGAPAPKGRSGRSSPPSASASLTARRSVSGTRASSTCLAKRRGSSVSTASPASANTTSPTCPQTPISSRSPRLSRRDGSANRRTSR